MGIIISAMADISCSGRALAESLKRQRETLKRLLREAGVPVEAARRRPRAERKGRGGV